MSSFSNGAAGSQQASQPKARARGQRTTATATSKPDPFQAEKNDEIDNYRSDADTEDTEYTEGTEGTEDTEDTEYTEDSEDTEDAEDSEDEPEYNWNRNGSEFLHRIAEELRSMSPAPPELSFSEHQQYWKAKFDSLIQEIRNDGTADTQLTEPPIRAFEIEILDCRTLDEHGCGLHCPCDLESRSAENTLFTLSHDTGLTYRIFLEQLRDILHSEEDQAQYSVAQDIFDGKLNFEHFNYIKTEGEIWKACGRDSEQKLPCVYVEVDGTRK